MLLPLVLDDGLVGHENEAILVGKPKFLGGDVECPLMSPL